MTLIGTKNYKTYSDLRGTTIGSLTLTSGTGFALKLVLKVHGLEYPRDYKLLNIGGASDRFTALISGQIAAAPVGSPLDITAEEMGFNVIGRFIDDVPDYQLNALTVSRSWAGKNRNLLVRFMKALIQATRWLHENKEAAVALLAREMKLNPEHTRKGWEYNVKNRVWDPEANLNFKGLETIIKIYGEINQLKGALPSPDKYVDQSYLKEVLKELGKR